MDDLTVTLTHEDIADLTNHMNNAFPKHEKPSQGYLEYLLCVAIKEIKNVDFFKEQNEKILTEEAEKPQTLGTILRSYLEKESSEKDWE